jgi:hypothetical protein
VPQASGEFFIGHLNTCDMAEATRLRPMAGAAFNQAVVALERTVTIQPRNLDEADAFALIAKWLVEERPFWNIDDLQQVDSGRHERQLEFLDE